MAATRRIARPDCVLALAAFAALIPALLIIPKRIPTGDTNIISAAAAAGYDTEAAFWTVFVWAVLAISASLLIHRRGPGRTSDAPGSAEIGTVASGPGPARGKLNWLELLAVFSLFALAYFPVFLARHGPYMEDLIFLSALHRMECGQLPYADFAFLYGPLMIYPLWAWSQAFGVSMVSYFGYLAILEGLQFALLMGVLQCLLPDRKSRYWVFLLLLPFLFNTLLGLNYNGIRRLLPALILVLLACRPHDRSANVAGALLIGLTLAYSHEYGIAALLAALAIYAVMFFWGQRAASLKSAALVAAGGISVWVAVNLAILGSTATSYFELSTNVAAMMSSGHAAFRFYWTANSLALFGLLTLACVAVGKGLLPWQDGSLRSGDRLLIGAIVFAIVMLKSGLTRSDLWHLSGGFVALLLAFLLPLPRSAMAIGMPERRAASALVVVASVTYLVGIAPTGSLYALSYVRGFLDLFRAAQPAVEAKTRAPSLELERSNPRPEFVSMGSYLAQPERAGRPVLFYGRAWPVPLRVGVCAGDYKLDDLMYTEFRQPESSYLQEHPDALVVMRSDDYERLYAPRDPAGAAPRLQITPTKQLGRWLSTVHYDAAAIEGRLQDEARDRLTGNYVRARYRLAARFGEYVVLEPK
jgi:hypothetical protein